MIVSLSCLSGRVHSRQRQSGRDRLRTCESLTEDEPVIVDDHVAILFRRLLQQSLLEGLLGFHVGIGVALRRVTCEALHVSTDIFDDAETRIQLQSRSTA